MFKKNSENAQSRIDRQAVHGRRNDAGIEPGTFRRHIDADPESDRARLIKDKTAVEMQLCQLKAQITRAKDGFHFNKTSQTGYDQVARWESQRANLAGKLARMNNLLMQLNYDRKMKATEQQTDADAFPRIFMQLAKEMLAEEIYNRVVVAAVHRQREK